MKTNIAIIGGGLAGLRLASLLEMRGIDYKLVEARDRLGGRILSTPTHGLDLGPAWFWSGQPRIEQLITDLGHDWFEQFSTGKLVYQDEAGSVRRDLDFSTMAGSRRLVGGLSALIEALASTLPKDRIHVNWPVASVAKTQTSIEIKSPTGNAIEADRVVIALPPRLAASHLTFTPSLIPAQRDAMRAIPTWMAGHAKVIAVYDQPFWRQLGLSGDGISRRGPLMEIHDASPADQSVGALFGFVGVPAGIRTSKANHLLQAATDQLTQMLGENAANPREILLSDWALERYTAVEDDFVSPAGHPSYGTPLSLRRIWEGSLILASTEMAPAFGGFLEGALEAAENAFHAISV